MVDRGRTVVNLTVLLLHLSQFRKVVLPVAFSWSLGFEGEGSKKESKLPNDTSQKLIFFYVN